MDPENPLESLGRRIRKDRESLSLTQGALGSALRIDRSEVSRIESGDRRLTARLVSQLGFVIHGDPDAYVDEWRRADRLESEKRSRRSALDRLPTDADNPDSYPFVDLSLSTKLVVKPDGVVVREVRQFAAIGDGIDTMWLHRCVWSTGVDAVKTIPLEVSGGDVVDTIRTGGNCVAVRIRLTEPLANGEPGRLLVGLDVPLMRPRYLLNPRYEMTRFSIEADYTGLASPPRVWRIANATPNQVADVPPPLDGAGWQEELQLEWRCVEAHFGHHPYSSTPLLTGRCYGLVWLAA